MWDSQEKQSIKRSSLRRDIGLTTVHCIRVALLYAWLVTPDRGNVD